MTPTPDLAPGSRAATAAFYQRSSAVGLLRTTLRTAQSVWPALAVRLAKSLFLTPLPPKWLQRGRPWGAGWEVESLPFERTGITLYRAAAAPGSEARPQVLLTHGWAGNARQLRPVAETLREAGLQPVIVEMPGHGRSAGWSSSLPQFARALDFVAHGLVQRGGRIEALVAHSLGGSAALHAMARGLPAARLVLFAAPDAPRDYTFLFAEVFGLSERTRAAMQSRIESREGLWMAQFDAGWSAPSVTRPTLVVHDEGDRVNTVSSAKRLAGLLARAELLLTQGLGHRRVLEDPDVLSRVRSFVTASGGSWGG